jgi:hypothetical protein
MSILENWVTTTAEVGYENVGIFVTTASNYLLVFRIRHIKNAITCDLVCENCQ